jgi:hypothetical protein
MTALLDPGMDPTVLHVTPSWRHVLLDVVGAAVVVAVGVTLLVGVFTLLHERRSTR